MREGITEIEDEAFSNCDKSEKIKIPDSVTSIGECAFYACSSLKEINLTYDLTSINFDIRFRLFFINNKINTKEFLNW